jgi:shikimate kinase
MKNIYLVGFMGTGKSAVGQELARQKKMQFVDSDQLIEEKEKREIAKIFTREGEAYFRKVEKEVLAGISQKENQVVACGGGMVIDPDNIRTMQSSGIIICLSASPEVILERTRLFRHRPLLNVANPKDKIVSLLAERAPYYAQADKIIDTSKISVKEIVKKILEFIAEKND